MICKLDLTLRLKAKYNLEGGYHGQDAKDAHHIIDFVDPEEPFENHSWGGALGKKALFLDEYQ